VLITNFENRIELQEKDKNLNFALFKELNYSKNYLKKEKG
jgi:hypothetical protein